MTCDSQTVEIFIDDIFLSPHKQVNVVKVLIVGWETSCE